MMRHWQYTPRYAAQAITCAQPLLTPPAPCPPHCQALVSKYSAQLPSTAINALVEEAAALVTDGDLSVAAHSLSLCCTLLKHYAASAVAIADRVLPQALGLVKSALLQVGARARLPD